MRLAAGTELILTVARSNNPAIYAEDKPSKEAIGVKCAGQLQDGRNLLTCSPDPWLHSATACLYKVRFKCRQPHPLNLWTRTDFEKLLGEFFF